MTVSSTARNALTVVGRVRLLAMFDSAKNPVQLFSDSDGLYENLRVDAAMAKERAADPAFLIGAGGSLSAESRASVHMYIDQIGDVTTAWQCM